MQNIDNTTETKNYSCKNKLIYGYAGCPVSIRDNNEQWMNIFINYISKYFGIFYR